MVNTKTIMQIIHYSLHSIEMTNHIKSVREKIYEKKLTALSSSKEQKFLKLTNFNFPTQ